jgi:putative FmdB family regulatory protein
MPLYEFHCAGCDRDFELLVRSSDWKGTPCPHCGSKKLSKQLSTFATAVASGTTGPMPCDFGGCPTPQRKRGGCCGGGPHHH